MPDELTQDEAEALHRNLRTLTDELRSQLASSEEGARPVDLDVPIGRLSRMDALQQQSMVRANRASAQLRLQQAEAALRRIEQEDYGGCVECGEEVGFARLEVRPETAFCVRCQSLRESRKP